MIQAAVTEQYTPEDLLRLGSDKLYELVDGRLVENRMSSESSWIATRLARWLEAYIEQLQLGWVWVENTFQCFPDAPNKVRRPDIAFVRAGRLPDNRPSRGHERVMPDLVVEVVSPNDLAEEIETRIDEFLRGGVRLIWVIYPHTRTAYVVHPDKTAKRLGAGDELDGEDVVPGFRCALSDLFPAEPR
jgi:Uma2 family endonuclease